MEELKEMRDYLFRIKCGAELALKREDSGISKNIIRSDIKKYKQRIEILDRAIEIMEEYKRLPLE